MHSEPQTISKPLQAGGRAPLRILIAAGGTGGHVYPAIAIADALQEEHPAIEIRFAGTREHLEWEAVPRSGYDIEPIWISGFHRRLTPRNLLFPLKLGVSLWQSLRIIAKFRPAAMISCGGYAAGPVGWVAAKRKVPLFIQEQNSFPGVTNRLLGRHAVKIFTAFREAARHFPRDKTVLAGNPTRKSLRQVDPAAGCKHFGFRTDRPTLLVLGGSGGARSINNAIQKNIDRLHDELGLQIIWQCGSRYYEGLRQQIDTDRYPHLRLVDFLHHMPEAYAAADIVVSRAGALSCSEIALTGNPSILVPSPNVAGDHQTKNAESMVSSGAARMIADAEAGRELPRLVQQMVSDRQQLKAMQQAALGLARPDAARQIAREILDNIQTENA